jgi:hypothetical protein
MASPARAGTIYVLAGKDDPRQVAVSTASATGAAPKSSPMGWNRAFR